MRAYDIITKKRDGLELSSEEIAYIVSAYTAGHVPDYQMSALLMAILFRGMSERETKDLTLAMAHSGSMMDLAGIAGIKVDKHSTGGVADTTTLVLAPLAAAAGVPVAKMSGRGLGHTGGTIDKLEAIPGFRVALTPDEFIRNVNTIKIAIIGQTAQLAPADGKLYALRDVTGTVESIPLIASSVMSKKIAAGSNAIVLDVKYGSGAFMKDVSRAKELAETMVKIGNNAGRRTVALVTNMDEPLGRAIGNALEVREAIETLRGEGPVELKALCLELGAHMLVLSGIVGTVEQAYPILNKALDSGAALETFRMFVRAQDGDERVVDRLDLLPQAAHVIPVAAPQTGYIQHIDTDLVGICAMRLGAGRATKEDVIDLAVGIMNYKRVGDYVERGEPLAFIHANKLGDVEDIKETLISTYQVGEGKVSPQPLIYSTILK
jgi:pyrimidine-nucleoside phosphorylase